jgi:transposase
MVAVNISSKDLEQLYQLKKHPHPLVRRKAEALILKSQNLPHAIIATIVGVCPNTIRNYFIGYNNKGLEFVESINAYKPQSKLVSFEQTIKDYLDKTPPATIAQACAEIGQLTGVYLKATQMRQYLKNKLGAAHRKVGGIPAKADPEEQRKFKQAKLDPRLAQAKAGKRTVYFMDGAHFVLGGFLGYLWSLTRIFVQTPSGRQRFNVLGALNAVTKELLTITNNTYLTSTQVCELLALIAQDKTKPITVVLDNARYQRCKLVTDLAQKLKIELLFLPPYSPNLNLIERVWKFVRANCLNSKYYKDFNTFQLTLSTFLKTMHQTHHQKLQSLLTLNFQLFKQTQKAIERSV